jgi:signal transduction histidine kinase
VQLSADTPQTYYLRVASVGSITTPLTLWEPAAFSYATQTDYLWIAGYYGTAAALLIFNFFLFLSLRDRNYLTYCGFLLFTALGMWVMNGFGAYSLALIDWPKTIGTNTLFAMAGVFGIEFLRGFLRTREALPRADWLLRGLIAAFALVAVLPVLDWPIRFGVISLSALAVITAPLMLVITVICWLRGYRSARFLLAAWTVLLVAVSVQAARNFALVPTNAITLNLMQIGSLLEMLLLTFALADRIQTERRAREAAQADALTAEAARVRVLRDSERQLESKVRERTDALESALARERATLNQYIEFGALIAHEFRNPLAIISNQAELARLEQQQGHVSSEPRFQTIARAADRLRQLFDQWLRNDRLYDRLDAMEPHTINLGEWLATRVRASHSRVRIEPGDEAAATETVRADEALLASAVDNLIDNAVKYSPAGTPIQVGIRRTATSIGIAVSDAGAGIDPADHTRIFEKHRRGSDPTHRRGLGLGLYFVAEVMRAHDGEVSVDSAPGRGSRFTLWLPRPYTPASP